MCISDVIVIDTWMLFPHRLRQLTVLPLHVPVHSLAITTSNSHIFAGLRDGKLIIIGVKNRSEIRWRRCHPWGLKLNRSFIKRCLNCVCTCTHVMIKHLLSPPRWLIWYLKRTMFILCCILCCIWISLQHYYLYANYNAGGTHGSCHFLIIAFLMGDFLVYIFFQQHKQIEIFICCTQLNVICLPNCKIQRWFIC